MINNALIVYAFFVMLWQLLIIANVIKYKNNVACILYKKCYTYLIISTIILLLIYYSSVTLILIPVIGLFEIVYTYIKSKQRIFILLASLIIYLLISGLFVCYLTKHDVVNMIKLYLLVNVFDANSQLFGMLCGKRKILPSISPNKTVEGSICGLASIVLMSFFLYSPSVLSLIYVLCVAILAFIGDMLASIYKRKIGIKDFNKLLPNHGGILDRFDSYIMVGAFIYLLFIA